MITIPTFPKEFEPENGYWQCNECGCIHGSHPRYCAGGCDKGFTKVKKDESWRFV